MDAPFVYILMNSEGWLKNIGDRNIKTVADAENYIQKNYFSLYEKHGFGPYLVSLKDTGEPIGSAGLYKREDLDHPDIGFAFLSEYFNQGFAFESASSVLKFASEELCISKVFGFTLEENRNSIKLLKKIGLSEDGIYTYEDGEELLLFSKQLNKMITEKDKEFIKRAIQLSQKGMDNNAGGPFGAIVVKDGEIIAEGFNKVTSSNDPTAHAEVVAIREACKKLNSFQLDDCTIYTSCEPCPMCLGAIYWARPKAVFYACTKEDAAEIGFDDQFIYEEIETEIGNRKVKFINLGREEGRKVFKNWTTKEGRTDY